MPPKVGRRPAAAALRGFRRPSRREPSPPQPTVRASLLEGKEVGVREVPLSEWETGRRLALKGVYWEEDCEFAGVLKALSLHDGIQELKMRLEGTKNESLLKWVGENPDKEVTVHLCGEDCGQTFSQDGYLHASLVKVVREGQASPWMSNLIGMAAVPEEDDLAVLRQREKEVLEKKRERNSSRRPRQKEKAARSSSSGKRKKKKRKKERLRADGKKALDSLFRNTGLDPRWKVRKRFKKMGRKAASRKTKKSVTSSTSSTSSSSTGSVDGEDLFGEELRVKKVWKRYPGVLAGSLVETMQEALLSTTGQLWEVNKEQLPPILSQYWKQHLAPRMTGPMKRECQTLAFLGDLLLQGQAAGALDVVGQRLKALEQSSQGIHFTIAQKIELVPQELTQITSNVETLEAGKLTREDAKVRQVGNRLWNSKGEEQKGGKGKDKGKNLELKGGGKGRGQGHQEEKRNQQNEDKGKKR